MALECAQKDWLLEIHAHQKVHVGETVKEVASAGPLRRVISASVETQAGVAADDSFKRCSHIQQEAFISSGGAYPPRLEILMALLGHRRH
ncbi:hypothetical protein [Edaphobacter aggregans]|uniref:hypothetical protein n=1 Tax=Edaphobacter aggregans TaxID=570835 RepID=UPI000554E3C9|nr:hypothetical protein [Edaphobacter aggregans]